MYGPFAVCVKK